MYDIEMSEANKLIDGTKRDAAAANMKLQKSDQDLNRLKARLNEVLSLSDSDKKNIEALQQKFAENQAVRFLFFFEFLSTSSAFCRLSFLIAN